MKKKIIPVLCVLLLIVGVFFFAVGLPLIRKYTPTREQKDLYSYYNLTAEDQAAIILNNELCDSKAKIMNGTIYISYTFTHENLNQRIYYDPNENLMLYAFDTELLEAEPDQVYSEYSDAPLITVIDSDAYINLDFLEKYSDFLVNTYENPYRVVITNQWDPIEIANPTTATELRTLGGIKCPIVETVDTDNQLTVLARDTKWTKVISDDGIIGYIKTSKLSRSTEITPVSNYTEEQHEHIFLDETICMAWDQITSSDSNSSISETLKNLKGINVISPTWFCLSDDDGNITSYASEEYVTACHENGLQVWPSLNDVDFPDVDVDSVLSHTSTRQNMIRSVISCAIKAGCDGINVDIERTTEKESESSYIELIRELSIQCAENNLILSVDNAYPYSFNNYYQRSEQANYADYLIFMGYDEHYAGSEDGSVSSLAWAEEGIKENLAQGVPANQLILGCPFYTRLWAITPETDSAETGDRLTDNEITSTVYGMSQAADLLQSKKVTAIWDSNIKQSYVAWTEGDTTYEIWMEDNDSVKERLSLMQDYELAGVSFWRLGLESNDIWDTIASYVK